MTPRLYIPSPIQLPRCLVGPLTLIPASALHCPRLSFRPKDGKVNFTTPWSAAMLGAEALPSTEPLSCTEPGCEWQKITTRKAARAHARSPHKRGMHVFVAATEAQIKEYQRGLRRRSKAGLRYEVSLGGSTAVRGRPRGGLTGRLSAVDWWPGA